MVFCAAGAGIASRATAAEDDAEIAASLTDAIVGHWVGTAAQPEQDPYDVTLTFVSATGGISRYPGDPPCGGILVGSRKGSTYEYQESITYNGTDEKPDGCINGRLVLTVDGDTMKFDFSGDDNNGTTLTSTGELKRKSKRR
jgi:hypothetical protein